MVKWSVVSPFFSRSVKAVSLNHRVLGQGSPLFILHGLLGCLDNWISLGQRLAAFFTVYLVDLRNHGRSPHRDEMTYFAMAEDLSALLTSIGYPRVNILGHSMGGKAAMCFALLNPDRIRKLAIVDIAPKNYPTRYAEIFRAMMDIDLTVVRDRNEVSNQLAEKITSRGLLQFLIKNIGFHASKGYFWKPNLSALSRHLADINGWPPMDRIFQGETLFIRGENSDYIQKEDMPPLRRYFPRSRLASVTRASHWVHADRPDEVFRLVKESMQ